MGVLSVFTGLTALADIGATLGTGNYDTSGMVGMAGDVATLGAVYGASAATMGETAPTILYLTLDIITAMEWLNGFGHPDEGGKFTDGTSKFDAVYDDLMAAYQNPGKWQGDAADAYQDQNHQQQDRAMSIKDADQMMANLLKRQAGQVELVREGLAGTKLTLAGAITVALAMVAAKRAWSLVPPVAESIGLGLLSYTIAISLAAGVTAFVLVDNLMGQGNSNELDVRTALDKYNEVLAKATEVTKRTHTAVNAPVAAESRVSSFSAISGPPAMSSLAGVASGSGDELTPISAVTGDGFGDDSPAEPVTPETPAAPATTSSTIPSLSDVTTLAGQAAKLSGPISQYSSMVNQAVGQIQQQAQQLASMGKPGEDAPAEDSPAEEADGAGAGPGAGHAEGVPLEVAAAGAEAAQQPGPVGRVV